MRAEELVQLAKRQPFIPIRLHLTTGQTYDIRHPELMWVYRQRVDVALNPDPKTGVLDRSEHLSLLHIVRVEDLESSASPKGSNGDAAA
jgi:hypothetical protein